jgi:hypothetical protein
MQIYRAFKKTICICWAISNGFPDKYVSDTDEDDSDESDGDFHTEEDIWWSTVMMKSACNDSDQ